MFNISSGTEVLKILIWLILWYACMFIVVYVFTIPWVQSCMLLHCFSFFANTGYIYVYLRPTRTTIFCCWHVLWIDWLELELIIWWMELLWKRGMELLPCLMMLRDQIHFCHWLVMILTHGHLTHGIPQMISFIDYR